MTVLASATTTVRATPQQVLELVLDLERYAEIDPKIVRVRAVQPPDDAGNGAVRLMSRLRYPPPVPDKHDIRLERWTSVTFTGAQWQIGRIAFDFEGYFECVPNGEETTVTHSCIFTFHGPFRLMERGLENWLQTQVDAELSRLAAEFMPTS